MRTKASEYIGKSINYLKILSVDKQNGRTYFKCLCNCGLMFKARSDLVICEDTKSCGCMKNILCGNTRRLPEGQAAFNIVYNKYKEQHAKQRGLKFSLSKDEFKQLIFNNCFYCDAEPKSRSLGYGGYHLAYNGIDRVNNNAGYIITNCVSCCRACNTSKLNRSAAEFVEWLGNIIKNYDNIRKALI